jgi:phage host-nuclease inhibitor protein Gam
MATLKIGCPEALDAAAAELVRLKINLTRMTAAHEVELVSAQKSFDARTANLRERIQAEEEELRAYCLAHANDPAVFDGRKSRETSLATFGFRTTPPRVEPANRKIKWADVIERLKRLAWGPAYLRLGNVSVDKAALLADRGTIPAGDLSAAGIRFEQDEEWFLEPKPETANALN